MFLNYSLKNKIEISMEKIKFLIQSNYFQTCAKVTLKFDIETYPIYRIDIIIIFKWIRGDYSVISKIPTMSHGLLLFSNQQESIFKWFLCKNAYNLERLVFAMKYRNVDERTEAEMKIWIILYKIMRPVK